MSLYRRGTIWWCEWQIGGRRTRESTGTTDRQAAREYHDRRRAELWRNTKLGERPLITWDAAALDWWQSHAQHKRSANDDRLRLRWVTQHLTGRALESITTALLGAIRDRHPASSSTRNRHLAVISAVLHHARRRDWLASVPAIPYTREPAGRIDWLTPAEACALCRELPLHIGLMAAFSLATGVRRHNCTHLQWSQLDAARRIAWVHSDQAKAGKPLGIPLNGAALAIIDMQRGAHLRWVFPWRGAALTNPAQVAWQAACARIGRSGFLWHGLRHTWASWHVQNGTPLEVLQKLGGWASYAMVLRYAHLAPGYVAPYADALPWGQAATHDFATRPDSDAARGSAGNAVKSVGWTMGLEPTTTGITILQNRRKA
jgi:integrase